MGLFKSHVMMAFSPGWSAPVSRLLRIMSAQIQGGVRSDIRGSELEKNKSVRVFIVGEQVVEDSEGGLEVQVDDIWKTKLRQQGSLEFDELLKEENVDL